jgi:hypothetical protein
MDTSNPTARTQVMKKDVGKAINILGDILMNSQLDERAIQRERDVILREMEEVRLLTNDESCVLMVWPAAWRARCAARGPHHCPAHALAQSPPRAHLTRPPSPPPRRPGQQADERARV